jgi:HlyD family secretion protein
MIDIKEELGSLRIDRADPRPGRRRWPLRLALACLPVLVFLYSIRAGGAIRTAAPETPPSVPAAAPGDTSASLLTASGYVVARKQAVISAKIQGRLAELGVEEGSRLERGEIIARLESHDYEAQLLKARAGAQRAEAELVESRRQLHVARELAAQQLVSEDQLQVAASRLSVSEAEYAQAPADVVVAEADLEKTLIKAPFRGVVVKKMAEVGESVAPMLPGLNLSASSGAIVALADLDTLEVEVDVSESNVAKLRPRHAAEVTVEAFPDRRYRGVLRQVVPTADRTKATVQVKVTILDADPQLKPEMSAKVTFLETAKTLGGP